MARQVRIAPLTPYDGKTGLLAPFVLERIRRMARERAQELDADQAVKNVGARFYAGDPSLLLLAFLDEKTQLVGHGVATVESDGTNSWVFVSQVGMDPGDWGDAVVQAMELADAWAQTFSERILVPRGQKPIQKMLMATHREERGWIRKYGFTSHRHIMSRDVGSKADEGQNEKGEGS